MEQVKQKIKDKPTKATRKKFGGVRKTCLLSVPSNPSGKVPPRNLVRLP